MSDPTPEETRAREQGEPLMAYLTHVLHEVAGVEVEDPIAGLLCELVHVVRGEHIDPKYLSWLVEGAARHYATMRSRLAAPVESREPDGWVDPTVVNAFRRGDMSMIPIREGRMPDSLPAYIGSPSATKAMHTSADVGRNTFPVAAVDRSPTDPDTYDLPAPGERSEARGERGPEWEDHDREARRLERQYAPVDRETDRLREEVARLRKDRDMLLRERKEEVWCWQGDGEDHPESLGCPVLIDPQDLRAILSEREEAERLRETLEEIAEYHGKGRANAPWQEMVADLGEIALRALTRTTPDTGEDDGEA